MASTNNQSPRKTKGNKEQEPVNMVDEFASGVVRKQSAGKFVCPNAKVAESRVTLNHTSKELSGVKSLYRKDALLESALDDAKKAAEAERVRIGGKKTDLPSLMDMTFMEALPQYFPSGQELTGMSDEEADFLKNQFVYVPALGLCGTLFSISYYLKSVVFSKESSEVALSASRYIVKYIAEMVGTRNGNVISVLNLVWDTEKYELGFNTLFNFDASLYSKRNLTEDGTELTAEGMTAAKGLATRIRNFLTVVGKNLSNATKWWTVDITKAAVRNALDTLFSHTTAIAYSDLPLKSKGEFATVPVVVKKIRHENLFDLLMTTGVVKKINFKAPSYKDEKGTRETHNFDGYSLEEKNEFFYRIPIKFEGAGSGSSDKSSGGARGKSQSRASSSAIHVLQRYLAWAGYSLDSADDVDEMADVMTDIISGLREADVTNDFLNSDTSRGYTGFRANKIQRGGSHQIMFRNTHEITEATIRNLWNLHMDGNYGNEFWTEFLNLIKRTVKISKTRASNANGKEIPARESEEKAREFFNILLAGAEVSEGYELPSVDSIMSDFSLPSTRTGSSTNFSM